MQKALLTASLIAALLAASLWLLDYRPGAAVSPAPGAAGGSGTPAAAGFRLETPAQPRPVPELHFVTGAGEPRSLSELRGRVVLLNIWATWCGPCRAEMPSLDRLQARLGGRGLEVVALSIDRQGPGVVRDFYAELGIEHLGVFLDPTGEVTSTLNVLGIPTTLLIDAQGREIGRKVGPAEWDSDEVAAVIARHLEAPPPGTAAAGAGAPAGPPAAPAGGGGGARRG